MPNTINDHALPIWRESFRLYMSEAAFYSTARNSERNPSTRLWLATRVSKYRALAREAAERMSK
jgi:hypothetical protein